MCEVLSFIFHVSSALLLGEEVKAKWQTNVITFLWKYREPMALLWFIFSVTYSCCTCSVLRNLVYKPVTRIPQFLNCLELLYICTFIKVYAILEIVACYHYIGLKS